LQQKAAQLINIWINKILMIRSMLLLFNYRENSRIYNSSLQYKANFCLAWNIAI